MHLEQAPSTYCIPSYLTPLQSAALRNYPAIVSNAPESAPPPAFALEHLISHAFGICSNIDKTRENAAHIAHWGTYRQLGVRRAPARRSKNVAPTMSTGVRWRAPGKN